MQIAVNAVADIIKQRSKRFSNARSIIAMAPATGGARENCGTQQALRIDDLVVLLRADIAETFLDFRYRGRSVQRLSPAPPRDRNDLVYRGMQTDQGCKRLLDQPAESRIRVRLPSIRQGRHMMNHIAERRRFDEKNVGHARC
jgi:hypothetical protein